MPNCLQGRIPSLSYILGAFSISGTCLVIAFLSLRRPAFYSKHRHGFALAWRLSVLVWPSFLAVMEQQHVDAVIKYPIVGFLMGSTLMTNLMTSACAPLDFRLSIWLNILVSIRQLFEQWKTCSITSLTPLRPAGALSQLQIFIALLIPMRTGPSSLLAILPEANLCFLLFATVEICVLSLCWWAMRWAETSSRIHFLKHSLMHEEHPPIIFKYQVELFKLSLDDPIVSTIRTCCSCLWLVATMWAVVITLSLNL